MSPALAGGVLSTVPPGKPRQNWFFMAAALSRIRRLQCDDLVKGLANGPGHSVVDFNIISDISDYHLSCQVVS